MDLTVQMYSSIAEEGSVRLSKAMFAIAPYLCNLWNKACIANRTSLTLVLLVHGLNEFKGAFEQKIIYFPVDFQYIDSYIVDNTYPF